MDFETELGFAKETIELLREQNRELRIRCGQEADPNILAWEAEIERQRGVIRDLRAEIDRLNTQQDQEFRGQKRYREIRQDRDHYRALVTRLSEVMREWGEVE